MVLKEYKCYIQILTMFPNKICTSYLKQVLRLENTILINNTKKQ